jgi:hypothetical protein
MSEAPALRYSADPRHGFSPIVIVASQLFAPSNTGSVSNSAGVEDPAVVPIRKRSLPGYGPCRLPSLSSVGASSVGPRHPRCQPVVERPRATLVNVIEQSESLRIIRDNRATEGALVVLRILRMISRVPIVAVNVPRGGCEPGNAIRWAGIAVDRATRWEAKSDEVGQQTP